MGTKAGGESHGSILLSGDPGIGKTTVVSALARLFGMEIMLIEVPHITEEHIINIPFIVFNPLT
ncbi:MAG: AAA family ATPase, partial [Nitrosopumilaceae archaeon]